MYCEKTKSLSCNGEMIEYNTRFNIFNFCNTCKKGCIKQLPNDQCCPKPDIIEVNYPRTDGSPLKRDFCRNCGWYKQKKMDYRDEWKHLPIISKDIVDTLEKEKENKRVSFFDYCKTEQEKLYNIENERFWKEYNEYLKSKNWKSIREKVLIRDNHLCQGCLKNKATQVHHLTYDHVFRELMFELTSVCNECHEKIHDRQFDI